MKILALVPPSKGKINIIRDLSYGCWCWGKRIGGARFPPLSLVQLASVLKEDSFQVSLIDAENSETNEDDLIKESGDYDAVVLLSSSVSITEDARLLSIIKEQKPELKTIVFGNYPTAEPEKTLSFPGIDIVARREPEYVVRDLLRGIKKGTKDWMMTKGISFLDNGKAAHNPDYPWIEQLDELPIPDRTLIPQGGVYFNPLVKALPYTTMVTSRGCSGNCTFCCSPLFYGRHTRYRSSEKVIEELKVISSAGYREVFFRDENFTFSHRRTVDICLGMLEEKLDLKWICSSRADLLDYATMDLMKAAGCHMMRIGVEAGVQELLDNIKKGISLKQIREVFRSANKLGIDTHAHMMIGIPGETEATVKNTMRFIREINPTVVTFGILIPYPGTALFEYLLNKHPQLSAGFHNNGGNLGLSRYLSGISEQRLISYVQSCYKSFYLRPGYLFNKIGRINNFKELRRALLAGMRILEFILGSEY